jgi:hypothetical protein
MGLGAAPGALAAALGAIIQPYRVLPEWESLFSGALLIVLCIATLSHFKMPGDLGRSLLFGIVWGFAILANPECVLLLFVWAHITAKNHSPEMQSRARSAMVWVVAGAALACLPWFIRNYQQFHTVFFVRDNLGIELFASNNPCARPTTLENIDSGCHAKTHPNANTDLDIEVVEKGEVQFNWEMLHRALSWIASNPRRFTVLTAQRFLRFWFPYLGSFRYSIPMGLVTLLSFGGLAWMFREQRFSASLLAATLLVYPLIHYVVQFEARYRYPIFWATLLPAAYAIVSVIRWLGGTRLAASNAGKEEQEVVSV